MRLRRTCREAAKLILTREDQALPWTERLALRMHLAVCDACPRFEKQIRTVGQAMKRWRHYSER